MSGERFKLERIGLIGLFYYSSQVFDAEDGHLLLRGPNGSGKSTAVELTVPLLLDGNLNPSNLSSGDGSRSMTYHLLLEGVHKGRTGYAWAEFSRAEEQDAFNGHGAQPARRYVTLALGAKASKDSEMRSWFVIWDSSERIDPDQLLVDARIPLSRRACGELAGAEVIDAVKDYRERVNSLLFGFSDERYLAMLKLVRSLRTAQLGRLLDVRKITELLELALPELDQQMLTEIGSSLDEIERQRNEVARLRGAYESCRRFVNLYTRYAKGVVSEQLETAAAKQRQLQASERDLAAIERRREEIAVELEEIAANERITKGELTHLGSGIQTLEHSDRMQALRELEEAQRLARRLGEVANKAEHDAGERGKELKEEAEGHAHLVSEHRERSRQLLGLIEKLTATFGPAGLSGLALEPTSGSLDALRLAAGIRREALAELGRLRSVLEGIEAEIRMIDKHLDPMETKQRTREARRDELSAALDAARTALAEQLLEWAAALELLELDNDELDAIQTLVYELSPEEPRLTAAVAGAERRILAAIEREAEREANARSQVELEQSELDTEAKALRDAENLLPPLAGWRDQPRRPLWLLCDFAQNVSAAERDGLETALEASGLLDAELGAGGELLAGDGELLLSPTAAAAGGRRLDQLLVASEGPERQRLATALAAIAVCGRDAAPGTSITLGLDGSFALGSALGRARPRPAAYVGAAAREAARERRLDEIAARQGELSEALAALDLRDKEREKRRTGLDAELAALPSADAVFSAWRGVRQAEIELRSTREELQGLRDQRRELEEQRDAAQAELDQYARSRELPSQADALQPVADALDTIDELLPAAERALERAQDKQAQIEKAVGRVRRSEERAREARDGADTALEESQQASGRAEALERAAGSEPQELLEEIAALREQLKQAEKRLRELMAAAEELRLERERDRGKEGLQREQIENRRSELDGHLRRLGALEGPGLFALAVEAPPAAVVTTAEAWEPGRIARTLREQRERLKVEQPATQNAVYTAFATLRDSLDASLGLEPVLEPAGDVPFVTANYGGGHSPVAAVIGMLGKELEDQEQALLEREQRLFEKFLFSEVAEKLRARIDDARELVEEASKAIGRCSTSSGMRLELAWRPREDLDEDMKEVLKLLRSHPMALEPAQQERLMRFFRAQLEEARVSEESGTLAEQLQRSLDYRRWYRFQIWVNKDGSREQLTRRRHGRGSGGEQAISLYLPLLAAYHALLAAADEHAPRLIALDEVFAGIDARGRSQLLAIMDDDFDLDFVLTSEKLWCCDPELHRLGIYQLSRHIGGPIGAIHYRWNGDTGRKELVADGAGRPDGVAVLVAERQASHGDASESSRLPA